MHPFFVASSFDTNYPDTFLSGTAYHQENIIIDSEGLIEYISKHGKNILSELKEGRFILAYLSKNKYFIRSDITGQELVFYYKSDDSWIVSTSFLYILEILSKKKIPVSLNKSALSVFRISHSFGDSLATNDSVVNEIKVLSANKQIIIDSNTKKFNILDIDDTKADIDKEVSETINEYINKWGRRISALSKLPNQHRIKCDISGGVDSRAVLGLILSSGVDLKRFDFSSNPSWVDDYNIAKILASAYGFKLNTISSNVVNKPLSITKQFELFCYSSIGVYRNVYLPTNNNSTNFHFSGSGGENIRQFYNATPNEFINRFKKYFTHENFVFEDFKDMFIKCLMEYNISPDDPKGMIKHYRNFRSRFHFGREWYKRYNAILITPLFDSTLNSLCDELPTDAIEKNSILLSMMIGSSLSLPLFPFDKPQKSFDVELYKSIVHSFIEQAPKNESASCEVFFNPEKNNFQNVFVDNHNYNFDSFSQAALERIKLLSDVNVMKFSSKEELLETIDVLSSEQSRAAYSKSTYLILLSYLQEYHVI